MIKLESNDGEVIYIAMRDSGFEVTYENKFIELKKAEVNEK